MTLQYSVTLRTDQVAALNTAIGASGSLKIFSGAEPANCAAADPTGLLCTITLPSTPFTAASGAVTLAGTWSGTASAAGTAASFRIYDGSAVCHLQGSVGMGTGDLSLVNTSIAATQPVQVTAFTVTAGNA